MPKLKKVLKSAKLAKKRKNPMIRQGTVDSAKVKAKSSKLAISDSDGDLTEDDSAGSEHRKPKDNAAKKILRDDLDSDENSGLASEMPSDSGDGSGDSSGAGNDDRNSDDPSTDSDEESSKNSSGHTESAFDGLFGDVDSDISMDTMPPKKRRRRVRRAKQRKKKASKIRKKQTKRGKRQALEHVKKGGTDWSERLADMEKKVERKRRRCIRNDAGVSADDDAEHEVFRLIARSFGQGLIGSGDGRRRCKRQTDRRQNQDS